MTQSALRAIPDFATFSSVTAAQFPAYRKLMRGQVEVLTINATERFTRNWINANVDLKGAFWAGSGTDIVAKVDQDKRTLNGFGLVVAAMLALRNEQYDAAGRIAERAYATDQHEVFAQRIFLAAAEQSQTLRLEVDDWLEDRFCANPFNDAEIIGSRDVYTCCAAWLPASIGTANTTDPKTYWQSTRAGEIRRSILDGDFGYCSRLSCPRISGRDLPKRADVQDPRLRAIIDTKNLKQVSNPRRILMSYDNSCNISCPSCRTKIITLGRKGAEDLDTFFDQSVVPLLTDATHIKVTGSGDPFGSRHFRSVLKKVTATQATEPRLQLQTNGVLFDKRAWDELGLEGHVRSVWISVVAVNEDTYAKLRRDGDFNRLIKNLHFLGQMRKEKRIGELRLDFVVQAENFKQMPAFVDLAHKVGADGVHFLMLRNWGTFAPEVYRDQAVAFDTHPEFDALLHVLRDPRLDLPGVDLGNLAPLRDRALEQADFCEAPAIVHRLAPVAAVLSTARTGTNYLMQGFAAFPNVLALLEIYNPVGAFGVERYNSMALRHINQAFNETFESETDPRLIAYVAAHPKDVFEQLRVAADQNNRDLVTLKIFDGQMPRNTLVHTVLNDKNVHPIILRRAFLPTYISYKKALATGAWAKVDTTDVKVSLDLEDFLDWMTSVQNWYDFVSKHLRDQGRKPILLRYSEFASLDGASVPAFLAKKLNSIDIDWAQSGLPVSKLTRQDRTRDPFERIENSAEFRELLLGAGMLDRSLDLPILAT